MSSPPLRREYLDRPPVSSPPLRREYLDPPALIFQLPQIQEHTFEPKTCFMLLFLKTLLRRFSTNFIFNPGCGISKFWFISQEKIDLMKFVRNPGFKTNLASSI